MSPACRASNDAIPPVWWRRHRQASHARVHVQRNSPRLLAVRSHLGAVWRPPGSPAPVREHDTRGNGGGFAALEASPRRVAGVSRP